MMASRLTRRSSIFMAVPTAGTAISTAATFRCWPAPVMPLLFVNPRGSTGYGDAFATALSGKWGVLDHKDLLDGVDYAIEAGFADPDRLGICGLSYGGYLTCYTIGQTNRFKAAVAENPITDLVSRYGTADMGPWGSLSELGGKPHEIPEVYRRGSPITYAHKCRTPTLLIQCEDGLPLSGGAGGTILRALESQWLRRGNAADSWPVSCGLDHRSHPRAKGAE